MNLTAPTNAVSWILVFVVPLTTIVTFLVLLPFLLDERRGKDNNTYLFFIAVGGFTVNFGFIIGSFFDFNSTISSWKEAIIEARKQEDIEEDEARLLWDEIQEIVNEYPDLEERLEHVKERVTTTAALVALIASEGYAKAEARGGASFVLNENLYDGTLTMGYSFKANSFIGEPSIFIALYPNDRINVFSSSNDCRNNLISAG